MGQIGSLQGDFPVEGQEPLCRSSDCAGLTVSSTAVTTRIYSSADCFGTITMLVSLCYMPYF